MGILGNIFSANTRRKARKQARNIRRLKQARLGTILSLTNIRQSQQQGSLQDRLFDAGLEQSAQGGRLQEQLDLQHRSEDQEIDIAGETLDLQSLQQKAADIQGNLEGIDQVLGLVTSLLGASGADKPPVQTQPAQISLPSLTAADVAAIPRTAGITAESAAADIRGTLTPGGQRQVVAGTGVLTTPMLAGFGTGATRAQPQQRRFGGQPIPR